MLLPNVESKRAVPGTCLYYPLKYLVSKGASPTRKVRVSPFSSQTNENTSQELDNLLSSTFQFNRLRGCSVAFGYLAVRRFLDNNDLLCVIRAHAVQEDGYYRHFEKALKRRSVGEDCFVRHSLIVYYLLIF